MEQKAGDDPVAVEKAVAQVHDHLTKRFQPAAKAVADAGVALSKSFQGLHKACDAYVNALRALAESGSTAFPEAKQRAGEIEKLAINMKDINDMNHAHIGKFAHLVSKMSSYSQKEKEILKQFYHEYEAREKEVKKEVHKGKKERSELQTFYEKEMRFAINQQLQRYKFLDEQHREWLHGYVILFQSARDVLSDEEKQTSEDQQKDAAELQTNGTNVKVEEEPTSIPNPTEETSEMPGIVENGLDILNSNENLGEFENFTMKRKSDASAQAIGMKDTGVQASSPNDAEVPRREDYNMRNFSPTPEVDYQVSEDHRRPVPSAKPVANDARYNRLDGLDEDEKYVNSFSRRQQQQYGYANVERRESAAPPRPRREDEYGGAPSPPERRVRQPRAPPIPERRQTPSSSADVDFEPFAYAPPKPPVRSSFPAGPPPEADLDEDRDRPPISSKPRADGVIFRSSNINAIPTPFVPTFRTQDYGKMLVCVHDFHAQSSTQLSLAAGERMVLIKSGNKGWIFAKHIETERTGWFPSRFAQLLSDGTNDTAL